MVLLPEGLAPCPVCGGIRGRTPYGSESLCFCDGISCRYCRAGRTRRPISDHFEPADGRWWHTPYFAAYIPCPHCFRLGRSVEPQGSWPGPLRNDLGLALLLNGLSEAADALRAPTEAFATDAMAPPGGLLAVHGDDDGWRRLGLPESPADRPLHVTTGALAQPVRALAEELVSHLSIATWTNPSARPLAVIEDCLQIRWRPPLDER